MPIAETTFVSVIRQHMYIKPFRFLNKGAIADCECGDSIFADFTSSPTEAIARHLSDKLIEAGFNPTPQPVEPVEPHLDPETCLNRNGRNVCPGVCWGCA